MLALTLALLAAPVADYAPCSHGPGDPRPAVDAAHREETRALVRAAVAELGGSELVARYLVAVAAHESGLQRELVHRLPADLAASARAWRRRRAALRRAGNPWADDAAAWRTYGLFGATSAYFAEHVPGGDPRLLCDLWSSVVAYLSRARALWPKLARCAGGRPTLADLYAAAQLGRACRRRRGLGGWPRLARAHGIDPAAPLRAADLGSPR